MAYDIIDDIIDTLETNGYRVVQVEDVGDEAILIVEDYGDSHYLINDMFDVVMNPTGYMDERGYEYKITPV